MNNQRVPRWPVAAFSRSERKLATGLRPACRTQGNAGFAAGLQDQISFIGFRVCGHGELPINLCHEEARNGQGSCASVHVLNTPAHGQKLENFLEIRCLPAILGDTEFNSSRMPAADLVQDEQHRCGQGPKDYVRSRGVQLEIIQDCECIHLMEEFIRTKPDLWNEDIGI